MTSIIIAIVLSLDAFSVALSLGLTKSSTKSNTLFATLVGIFHFIMPSLGSLTSFAIFKKIVINGNKLLGFVLIILTIQMLLDLRKNREFKIRPSIILLAFSVSVDSFFAGMGLGTQKDIKIANDGYGLDYYGSNARLKNEFKDVYFTPMETAIAELYDWYRKNINLIDKQKLTKDK